MAILKDTAFIVCSRTNSRRIENKPLQAVNGVAIIQHLIKRLLNTRIYTYLAVPDHDMRHFSYLKDVFHRDFHLVGGNAIDPMARMYDVAKKFDVKNIIRVCHDKILIDEACIQKAIHCYMTKNLDYLYSSKFTDGTAFEIISFDALEKAVKKHANIEHISYAIKSITDNVFNFTPPDYVQSGHRFLIDYVEDLTLMETLFAMKGNDVGLTDAIDCLDENPWMSRLNQLPTVTIYTCAHNAEKFIEAAMGSVIKQRSFINYEYIIIDDFSADKTPVIASKFASRYHNVKWFRNPHNIGLAASSSIALNHARGKYIIRLDADDFFIQSHAIELMLAEIIERDLDALYPNNYYGSHSAIQNGKAEHHVGGTLFRTRAVNHIKFMDKLRHYDSLDFFERAKDQLKIGYINKAIFFYRQHDESMSKNNLEEREQVRDDILC